MGVKGDGKISGTDIKARQTVRDKKSGAGAEHKTTWKYFYLFRFSQGQLKDNFIKM